MKIVHLTITAFGSRHFYGTLSADRPGSWQRKRVELSHSLTAAEALEMNKQRDGWVWRPGQNYPGFASEAAVISEALSVWKEAFPEAEILLLGTPTNRNPKVVLDGSDYLQTQSAYLAAECEKLYAGDRIEPSDWTRYERLCNEFAKLIAPFEVRL